MVARDPGNMEVGELEWKLLIHGYVAANFVQCTQAESSGEDFAKRRISRGQRLGHSAATAASLLALICRGQNKKVNDEDDTLMVNDDEMSKWASKNGEIELWRNEQARNSGLFLSEDNWKFRRKKKILQEATQNIHGIILQANKAQTNNAQFRG